MFPDKIKNNPRVRVSVGNYFIKNPSAMQQLVAANDSWAPKKMKWRQAGKISLKMIPRILGGVITMVLSPTQLGNGELPDANEQIIHNISMDVIRSDPEQFMQDVKNDYENQWFNKDGWKEDYYYKLAQTFKNDAIVKSLEGVVDPGLQKPQQI